MALSVKKKGILNKLFDYIPAFRKSQISPVDGGDIRLGDMLDGFKIATSALVTMAAAPQAVADAEAEIGDLVIAMLVSDDTGAALGGISASVTAVGVISIDAVNGVTNNDGVVRYFLVKAQA